MTISKWEKKIFQTDPANADYELEEGAIRNFESIRLAEKQAKEEAAKEAEEEAINPMKVSFSKILMNFQNWIQKILSF